MSDNPPEKPTGAITVPQVIKVVSPADAAKHVAITVRKEVSAAAFAPTELAGKSTDIDDPVAIKKLSPGRDLKQLIDSLEFQGSANRSPESTLRLAQLYLSACDAKSAHKVLKKLFEDFKAGRITLIHKQTSDASWFILKSVRMMPVNQETEQMFQEAVDLCADMSEQFAPASFREVKVILPLLLGIREGLKTQNMRYYDAAIQQAHSLDARGNKRIEAERLRIIGSAHLHKVVRAKADLSFAQKTYELREAEKYTRKAIELLEQLEHPLFFYEEGGELLRTRENLARVMLVAAQNIGDQAAVDARRVINETIDLATNTGNLLVSVRLMIMRSDLNRFAEFRDMEPTEAELKMAYDDIAAAYNDLNLLSDDRVKDTLHIDIDLLWETFIHVLINLTEIEYALGMRKQARTHYECVDGFLANIQDARLKAGGIELYLKHFKAKYADLTIEVVIEAADEPLYAIADNIATRILSIFFKGAALQPGEKIIVRLEELKPLQFILRTNIENFPNIAAQYIGVFARMIRYKLYLPNTAKVTVELSTID